MFVLDTKYELWYSYWLRIIDLSSGWLLLIGLVIDQYVYILDDPDIYKELYILGNNSNYIRYNYYWTFRF